jgi:hypothetical protein
VLLMSDESFTLCFPAALFASAVHLRESLTTKISISLNARLDSHYCMRANALLMVTSKLASTDFPI